MPHATIPNLSTKPWTFSEGGVIRGEVSNKRLALIFTGGDFGEGTGHILDVLAANQIKGSFFFTGDFLRKAELSGAVRRVVEEEHYLGPHSDAHPLYCPWEDRNKTLVSEEFFRQDLAKNIDDIRTLGGLKEGIVYFIPPYEYYNHDQVRWARKMDVLLFNCTPGTRSGRDWAPEGHKAFVPSQQIMDDILAYEQKDPHGLNGHLLLIHVGSERKDKSFVLLDSLVKELKRRGYEMVRVDQLLAL